MTMINTKARHAYTWRGRAWCLGVPRPEAGWQKLGQITSRQGGMDSRGRREFAGASAQRGTGGEA
jgi:hypothetical protein